MSALISKANGYVVIGPPLGAVVSKANGYVVIGPPLGAVVSKANGYVVLLSPIAKAVNANPSDGSENIPLLQVLSWEGVNFPDSYDVYFGKTAPGTFQGNQTETTFDPGVLDSGTTYYWRIDSKKSGEMDTIGDVWSFTTEGVASSVRPSVWVIT